MVHENRWCIKRVATLSNLKLQWLPEFSYAHRLSFFLFFSTQNSVVLSNCLRGCFHLSFPNGWLQFEEYGQAVSSSIRLTRIIPANNRQFNWVSASYYRTESVRDRRIYDIFGRDLYTSNMDAQLFNSRWEGRIPPSNGFGRICQLSLPSNYALGWIEIWKPVQLLFSPKFTKSIYDEIVICSTLRSIVSAIWWDMKNLYFRLTVDESQ